MNRRRREKRISYKMILIILILTAAIVIGLTAFTSQNAKADTANLYKYYTSYEVKSGDTLWTIAKKYSGNGAYDSVTGYIDEVCSINHLPSDTIYAGSEICIPYYSTEYKK